MESTTTPVAHALAYRWGELKEAPPDCVDDLMVDLTRALAEAERAENEERADCLDEVLDALAQGIVKHQGHVGQEPSEDAMAQAIAELRAHYYLESGLPAAWDSPRNSVDR